MTSHAMIELQELTNKNKLSKIFRSSEPDSLTVIDTESHLQPFARFVKVNYWMGDKSHHALHALTGAMCS